MSGWGRGWEVGARKAMWQQERTDRLAADILASECGDRHATGSRTDLCPKCQAASHSADTTDERGEDG